MKRLAWQAHASVCAGVMSVGPVVQSARFVKISRSLWGHSPVLILAASLDCVKVRSRDTRSALEGSEFVKSLLCGTGAVLCFGAVRAKFVAGAELSSLDADFVAGTSL